MSTTRHVRGHQGVGFVQLVYQFKFSQSLSFMSTKRKEGNILFNDALNTFYLRLYDVRHMVKDHSDSERGNPLPLHGLLFPISSKGLFYMHHPTDRIAHTTALVTPVVEHWLERHLTLTQGEIFRLLCDGA